MYCNGVVLKDN
jgi:hypothetical protein